MHASLDKAIDTAIHRAANLGRKHGKNAAAWVIQDTWGGRVTRGESAAAQQFLTGYDDGDPVVMDSFGAYVPNLANQWAGDLTPGALLEHAFPDWCDLAELEQDAGGDLCEEDICTAYIQAAEDAYWAALVTSARQVLAD